MVPFIVAESSNQQRFIHKGEVIMNDAARSDNVLRQENEALKQELRVLGRETLRCSTTCCQTVSTCLTRLSLRGTWTGPSPASRRGATCVDQRLRLDRCLKRGVGKNEGRRRTEEESGDKSPHSKSRWTAGR